MKKEMISIILVNYCNFKDTIETIESLKKQKTKYKYKIILVDNCSPDNSYIELKKYYKDDLDVDLILSDKNGGFSYGNNIGIKYAELNYQSEYFLLINNDTIADENILEEFMNYYLNNNNNDNIGILTGKIYYYNNPTQIWYAGGKLNKKRAGALHIGDKEIDKNQYSKIKEIDFATGCLIFFSYKLIKEIGYLPEEYFMYFEDVDFSWNVIKHQKKIIYLPRVKIWHKIGQSSNLLKSENSYFLFNRNRNILAMKYLPRVAYYNFKIFLFTRSLIKFLLHLGKDRRIINTFKGIHLIERIKK